MVIILDIVLRLKPIILNINNTKEKNTPENNMPHHCLKKIRSFKTLAPVLIIVLALVWHISVISAEAAETVSLPPQVVAPGDAALTVNLELPAGFKLNQEAPSTVGLKSGDPKIVAVDQKYAQQLPVANLPLCLTVPVKEGQTTLQANFRLNFCDEKLGLCFLKEVVLNLPVEVNKTATNKKLEMLYKVPAN